MAQLVVLTGPIAAGKNTVADALRALLLTDGMLVVTADLDVVAEMIADSDRFRLWPLAHSAHGALVGEWMRSGIDVVIAVAAVYTVEEQDALTRHLPPDAPVFWGLVDAPVEVTLARAQRDPTRVRSREPEFHLAAHRRFRELASGIPADLTFDSSTMTAEAIAGGIRDALR